MRLFTSFDPAWGRSYYELSFDAYKVEYITAGGGQTLDPAALVAQFAGDADAEVREDVSRRASLLLLCLLVLLLLLFVARLLLTLPR